MKKVRPVILTLTILFVAFLAYGFLTQPNPKPVESSGFSSARVVEDLKVIAKDNHSVAHPAARAVVCDYLQARLTELGANPVLYQYDSLESRGFTFDVKDIVAEFPPKKELKDTTYLMLVAHYDSRYPESYLRDTSVCSYGAADDGYGLGVILECLNQSLKTREYWNQGIKVLFTDAEEPGMVGMKSIYDMDRHVFDNVGMIINVEARGPWGPALMFETSPGNEKLVNLYAHSAKSPYTYSLTTVVYKMMPNFTDFSVVKDDIPGFNFSTVADINHYHTELDNIDNVSEKSIQHYGAQMLPLINKYLTSEEFASKDALKADEDLTFFTVPGLGIVKFTKTAYIVFNMILLLVFILLVVFEVLRGKSTFDKILIGTVLSLIVGIGVLGVGELVAYVSALVSDTPFKLFGTIRNIMGDNIIMIVSFAVLVILCTLIYLKFRADAKRSAMNSMRSSAMTAAIHRHAYKSLFGILFLLAILSTICLFTIGENLMFMIPLFFATLGFMLYAMTSLKLFLLASIAFTLLHAFSFLYALSMALTIGALGGVMMIGFFDIMVLLPLADLYLTPVEKSSRR